MVSTWFDWATAGEEGESCEAADRVVGGISHANNNHNNYRCKLYLLSYVTVLK